MDHQHEQSDALFETLNKNKKKKRRKLFRTVLIVIAIILGILVTVFSILRRKVEERFAEAAAEVLSYEVQPGTIHTLVSGSGTLTEEDLHTIRIHDSVEITEVLVQAGDSVKKGDVLATVNLSSLISAMADLQTEIGELDQLLAEAKNDEVDEEITAGLPGRVKILYAREGMDVESCMAQYGALAVLSLDNHMALEIDAGDLEKDTPIQAVREDGTVIPAVIGKLSLGRATILVPDNGPKDGETVTVFTKEGLELGSGSLSVYVPLSITGYAGTIRSVEVVENEYVSSGDVLFRLKDTSFSANYDALLRQRQELEEELLELLTIHRDGALISPMDGMVSTVETQDSTGSSGASLGAGSDLAAMYGAAMQNQSSGSEGLITLYPELRMSITIGIGETDILSLQVGQEAQVTVSSIGEEAFIGTVTEISREASSAMGISQYSAVVTLDRYRGMLPGMTADVDIRIEGVENALIIPLDALHETSAMSYVYTTYDEETMQYGGMVEVTTGMRNDSYVEILSGLSQGDVIRYTEAQFDFFAFINSQFGMGGNQRRGMGG